VARGELVVRYGLAFLERTVARLPLDTLEVRTADELTAAVQYDAHAVSRRLLAAVSPLPGAKLPKSEVRRYVLQVRSRGQDDWLSVMASQVASEVENARLALATAAQLDQAERETDEHGQARTSTDN
jgi:hypothetical protein